MANKEVTSGHAGKQPARNLFDSAATFREGRLDAEQEEDEMKSSHLAASLSSLPASFSGGSARLL